MAAEEQLKIYKRNYQRDHKDEHRLTTQRYRDKLKLSVLTHYSNGNCACIVCGFNDIRALSIDRINGNGSQERRKRGKNFTGNGFYRWLKINNYPEDYQTLCMNCQWIKRAENKEARGTPRG